MARHKRPLGRLWAPVLVPLADLHTRTRPTDEPPFSGTFLNLLSRILLPAEVFFQDRDRPVLRLPSA
jgi:hypothetical protein